MATSVPPVVFTAAGLQAPTEQDVLQALLADIDAAMGGGLNLALTTPQGQLASSLAAAIGNAYQAIVDLANQVDPAYASGRMQDAIARIYFLARKPSIPTAVTATLGGGSGVTIPTGSLARAADGNLYQSVEDATIGDGGTVDVRFEALAVGPLACAAGTLNEIYQAIPGWNTITNAADGMVGRDVESRAGFEGRRRESVAKNGRSSLNAILGAVLEVDDVIDAVVVENVNDTNSTIGGVVLAPHSILATVAGGLDADVARAIWSKKPPGGNYNGNTTVAVPDDAPEYTQPYPTYSVTFQRPKLLPFVVRVTLANNPEIPSDGAVRVQNAIIAAFSGAGGGERARIGGRVLASRLYSALTQLGAWAQVLSLLIGSGNAPAVTMTASIAGTTMTVTVASAALLAAGQTVNDLLQGAVVPGTKIVSQTSGTPGGVGVYVLSKTNAVSARALVAVSPSATSGTANMDQRPTVSADDIEVVLA